MVVDGVAKEVSIGMRICFGVYLPIPTFGDGCIGSILSVHHTGLEDY
jgi:hypothetical protein